MRVSVDINCRDILAQSKREKAPKTVEMLGLAYNRIAVPPTATGNTSVVEIELNHMCSVLKQRETVECIYSMLFRNNSMKLPAYCAASS
jgi:hypothetical protein